MDLLEILSGRPSPGLVDRGRGGPPSWSRSSLPPTNSSTRARTWQSKCFRFGMKGSPMDRNPLSFKKVWLDLPCSLVLLGKPSTTALVVILCEDVLIVEAVHIAVTSHQQDSEVVTGVEANGILDVGWYLMAASATSPGYSGKEYMFRQLPNLSAFQGFSSAREQSGKQSRALSVPQTDRHTKRFSLPFSSYPTEYIFALKSGNAVINTRFSENFPSYFLSGGKYSCTICPSPLPFPLLMDIL